MRHPLHNMNPLTTQVQREEEVQTHIQCVCLHGQGVSHAMHLLGLVDSGALCQQQL